MNPCIPPSPLRPDPLRWAIALCLFASPALHATDALQPATGPGGTPVISAANGVPVIAIVPPNASGLSHNQYLDYNVGAQGVVLNNALQAGQSALTGSELLANAQFNGQAASTILNEVISRQASIIAGSQEIFGRPADYILANPNGITVNGGSFINTTRAGFLVGTPVIEDQRIKYLDTLQAEGVLTVGDGGLSNLEGALDLIAPSIDVKGAMHAKNDQPLNITLGRNRIDADSGAVVEQHNEVRAVDARLMGAMRAGRIHLRNTSEGLGVQMGEGLIVAADSFTIDSAGDLTLMGTQGKARTIDVNAGQKLVFSAPPREHVTRDREAWDKKAWFIPTEEYSKERTQTDITQQSVQLHASEGMTLDSKGDMQLSAAKLKAGDGLTVKSGGDIKIEAGVDSRKVDEQIRHRKHLWRGDSDSQHYTEQANASTLEGANVSLSAGNTLQVKGSSVHSQGDLHVQAAHVEVGEQHLKDSDTQRNYSGDLVSGTFFGDRNGNDEQGSNAAGSTLRAEGKLTVSADDMTIKGSSVTSEGDAVLYSEKAGLTVEAAQSTRHGQKNSSDSKLFGLIGSSSESKTDSQQVLVSDVRSTSNLRLASVEEMKIRGANLQAGQALELSAKGDLHIDSAQSTDSTDTHSQQRYFTSAARQTQVAQDGKPGSRQYEAKVGYDVDSVEQRQANTHQVVSTLSGANVTLHSDTLLAASGAQVKTTDGDLTVKAPQVQLNAAHDTQQNSTVTTRSGGGLAVTGGIDRIGSAFEGHHNQHTLRESSSASRATELSSSGDLRIDATHLANEGTLARAGGQLLVNAESIDNRAAADTQEREQTTRNWQGSLGASVEYRDISRPIERLVEGREAARFQQAGVEDAMAPPSVGADLNIDHLARQEVDSRSVAQPTRFSAGATTVQAQRIDDQGTAYVASSGQVQIKADTHQLLAATDHTERSVQRLDAGGGLRVDTSTGEDINARGEGRYNTLDDVTRTSQARPGSLIAQTGIQVQLGSDGRYEGTRFNGGDGAVKVESAGTLTLAAARDTTHTSKTQVDSSAWGKGGNRPGSTGLDLRTYGDYSTHSSEDGKAQVASLLSKDAVQLLSSGDLTLEGTRIDAGTDSRVHSDGVLKVLAADDTHSASGNTLGGGMEVAVSAGTGTGKGGGIGGHVTSAAVDENTRQAVNAQFTSKDLLQLSSLAREDVALQLQGLQASTARIEIDARNGGLQIEASGNQDLRNNRDITAGAGFKLNRGETADKDVRGLHARVDVAVDKRDNQTWSDSTLRADQITLNSRSDTRIEGARLEAERIDGKVGGDLRVASRKDHVDTLTVAVDGRLSHEKNPQGYINAASSLAGPAAGKVQEKAGKTLARAEPGLSPTLKVDVSHQQRDTVTRQTSLSASQGIDLKVTGDTHLTGARLQAGAGGVELGGSDVTRETLTGSDYRRDVSFDLSNAPVDIGTALVDTFKDKGAAAGENALDLGLLRTSGHNRSEQWSSVVGRKGE